MKTRLRLWDRDFKSVSESDDFGWRLDEPSILTVPADSPTAKWLLDQRDPFAYLTCDNDKGRWHGRLDSFKLVRTADDFVGSYLKIEFVSETVALWYPSSAVTA